MLADWPDLAPARAAGGTPLTLSDAELLAMAVMSALPGFTSERRWLRYVNKNLAGMFPRRIGQSGYSKRMRKSVFLLIRVIRMLAMDTSLGRVPGHHLDFRSCAAGVSQARRMVLISAGVGWSG